MTRRFALLIPLAACLRADSEHDVRNLVASLADALSAGKVAAFLEGFDKSMRGLDTLRFNVDGLLSQADVGCSIEITENEGDDSARTVTLDWILTFEKKDLTPGTTRRQKTVHCRVKKMAKRWRIVSFEPLDLFASPWR